MVVKERIVMPLRVLEKMVEEEILVKLKDGSEYIGRLEKSDVSMNLILSDAKQVDENKNLIANFGRVLIRGSNILYISFTPNKVEPGG